MHLPFREHIHCTCQSLQEGPPKNRKGTYTYCSGIQQRDRLHLHQNNNDSNTKIIYGLHFMDVIGACVGFSFKLFLISLQRVDIEFVEIKQ